MATIEYVIFGGSYYLTTSAELKGRGIRKADNGKNHARGLKTYHATISAFSKLKENKNTKYNETQKVSNLC